MFPVPLVSGNLSADNSKTCATLQPHPSGGGGNMRDPGNEVDNSAKITCAANNRNIKMAHWFHRNPIKASAPVTFESIRNVATNSSSSKMLS